MEKYGSITLNVSYYPSILFFNNFLMYCSKNRNLRILLNTTKFWQKGACCHNGSIEKEFTRAHYRSHIIHKTYLWMPTLLAFSVQMASAALTRDRVLHYFPRQIKFYSLSFHIIDIERLFQRNKLLYYLESSPCLKTWASQQHKYLKHGSREPVASKKMMLGQVVPNFTGQVVSSKILRSLRWKLWVTFCSVPLSKWP